MKANADTTLQQFGGNKALAMIGGKAIKHPAGYAHGTLAIRFKGNRKVNYVTFELNVDDTYTLTFSKYSPSKFTLTKVQELDAVYCDQLQQVFESVTGLYLSL